MKGATEIGMEKEISDIKFFKELTDYFTAYGQAVIDEIFIGTGIALGLDEAAATQLANRNPHTLKKAFFKSIFKSIFDRLKNVFSHKIPPFRPKKEVFNRKKGTGGDDTPMTPAQWDVFNSYMDKYWKEVADNITGDVTTKSYLLGRETAKFREKKKPYKNKSLYQVVQDQFHGDMPDSIEKAYKKYDFNKSEKNVLNKSLSNVSMYVTQSNNEIKEAIRQNVTQGIDAGKSSTEIASDMYWNIQKDEEFTNKYSAETLKRNWSRVASTEMAYVYEAGILAPHEAEAMESLKNPKKAKYFVRTGGTCDWCQSVQGTIVRLIPAAIIEDSKDESLKSMGIDDPNTDIAIWPGKSNVGLKQKSWNICCPAHPWNVATFQPIDLQTEWYNPKSGSVERRQKKKEFEPQLTDWTYKSPEEKEYRKPTFIGSDLVRYNNNVYERVSLSDFQRKQSAWERDPSNPIPVKTNSTRYDKIFGEAERNR